jgi:CHAT domain-containing protein
LEEHLNEDRIDDFLRLASRGKEQSIVAGTGQAETLAHLNTCETCRSRVQAQERAMDQLALLHLKTSEVSGPNCPPDDVWIEVASGAATQDSENYLNHAAGCDHCGMLLNQAFELGNEELSPEEEELLFSLDSSSERWQKETASKLRAAGHEHAGSLEKEKLPSRDSKPSWFSFLLHPRGLAFAGGLVVLLALGGWFALRMKRESNFGRDESNLAGQLLASAYAEGRDLEVRIEGAPYVPMRQERGESGDQNRMSRPALLKAEAETAQHLQSNPEDVQWLQASGRASLLEDTSSAIENAVSVLEKAHRLAPTNQSVNIDLASAYLVRGQLADRPEDYGVAEDILAKVLVNRPEDEVAQFNRAIALEKLLLKVQAREAWQAFLKNHPTSPWAPEAQERLTRLNQEISDRSRRTGKPLESIDNVAGAFSRNNDAEIAAIDDQIEEYQDLSVHEWLPAYFGPDDGFGPPPERLNAALNGLAALLKTRHGDTWLAEMLLADRRSPQVRRAVRLLSHSDRMAQSSDDGPVEQEATEASRLFHEVGSTSGELRSQFVIALVQQLQHRRRTCEETAQALMKSLTNKHFAWIEIQSRLEAGVCADTSDKHAIRDMEAASDLASTHQYRVLAMRSLMFESGLFWVLGDEHRAWLIANQGLHTFWTGNYPNLRGYNMLVCLDDLVAGQNRALLEVSILKEAVPMIDGEPRPAMAAFEHDRLGQIEIECGDIDGAERSFYRSREIFNKLSPGLRRDALSAEADLGLAKVEYQRGNSQAAEERLQRIRPGILHIPDDRLALEYFQTSGIVSLNAGKLDDAEKDLKLAIALAERRLRLVSSDDDRWQWSHRNELSYRAMVELQLRRDPAMALRYWEWYKGAPLRTVQAGYSLPKHSFSVSDPSVPDGPPESLIDYRQISPGTALVSYYMAPNSLIVWVSDSAGTREQILSTGTSDISSRIDHFSELCSSSDSDLQQIKSEGSRLYEELLEPIEPWLNGDHRIVVEPDRAINELPFEALSERDGRYLAEHLEVTVSPGTAYLNHARDWSRVSSASKVLVLGNPEVEGWSSLPEAEQEARAIAALFPKSHLLLDHQASGVDVAQEIANEDVFHFAGHATASLRSAGLVIGKSRWMDSRDLETVSHGHIRLVVLSACVSSHGSTGSFDDQDSLVRRLMSARVPEVVASRWQVDSTATRHLMMAFYKRLIAGDSVSTSVETAARNVRSEPGFAHPYYWAGFSVFGEN